MSKLAKAADHAADQSRYTGESREAFIAGYLAYQEERTRVADAARRAETDRGATLEREAEAAAFAMTAEPTEHELLLEEVRVVDSGQARTHALGQTLRAIAPLKVTDVDQLRNAPDGALAQMVVRRDHGRGSLQEISAWYLKVDGGLTGEWLELNPGDRDDGETTWESRALPIIAQRDSRRAPGDVYLVYRPEQQETRAGKDALLTKVKTLLASLRQAVDYRDQTETSLDARLARAIETYKLDPLTVDDVAELPDNSLIQTIRFDDIWNKIDYWEGQGGRSWTQLDPGDRDDGEYSYPDSFIIGWPTQSSAGQEPGAAYLIHRGTRRRATLQKSSQK